MRILITKDGASKISRDVSAVEEVSAVLAAGFHVERDLGDGKAAPISLEQAAELLAPPEAEEPAAEAAPEPEAPAVEAAAQPEPAADAT